MARKATARLPVKEQEPYRAPQSRQQSVASAQAKCVGKIVPLTRKIAGAYYTPDDVARSLIRWVVRSCDDRLLDPACGDGRFIAEHPNSVGVDQDFVAVRQAVERAPNSTVHHADFFEWAASTNERFDCAVGNPPFIRYQHFKGPARERALSLCDKLGVTFSGLTSSWAPFLVAAASLLRPDGRIAFVVPAEIGHAPYAAPLLEYLVQHFAVVHVIAVRTKLFADLSEDCWLLYADGLGQKAREIQFTPVATFQPSATRPGPTVRLRVDEWRRVWRRRLRPLLLPAKVRDFYREATARPDTRRLGDLATVGIGYVSGGNDFFHLRPSQAARLELPDRFLHPTVRNGRVLTNTVLRSAAVKQWLRADEPALLLHVPKSTTDLPLSLQGYLATEEAARVREGYKCRHRDPWYTVPDVQVPDFFLTYLSGRSVALVRNDAGCTCTNALHYVRFKSLGDSDFVSSVWNNPFVRLSCEIEGHPLGGGLLKLEPREAAAIALPSIHARWEIDDSVAVEGISVLRAWRHYRLP